MIICGIKLTHDGAVAVVKDGRLLRCLEIEKLGNNRRFAGIEDTSAIPKLVEQAGVDPDEVQHYVLDGWGGYDNEELALQPRLEIGLDHNRISARDGET